MANESLPAGSQGWTIKKLLDWATDYFQKNNIENPHLEAEILLAHALGLKRIDLYVKFEKEPGKGELSKFKDYILRRKDREPSAYITGTKAFMSIDFFVNRLVLIPRPETELLVEAAMDIAKSMNEPHILDIGTGSGAVAVSLAKYIKDSRTHATDISQSAILVAIENAKRNNVLERTDFETADIFPKQPGTYDIIVANPPYIKTADIDSLAQEIREFEPRQALDGGKDGLDCFRKITENAGSFLKSGGYLLVEVGAGQSNDVAELIEKNLKPKTIAKKKDLNGIERVVIAQV